jgi:hypothetical protein
MTEYLWTNESAWCLCGHHIRDHEKWSSILAVCHGKDYKRGSRHRYGCYRFRPCRMKEKEEPGFLKTIYRLGQSDNWACSNCEIRGDRDFMLKHGCKGKSKELERLYWLDHDMI